MTLFPLVTCKNDPIYCKTVSTLTNIFNCAVYRPDWNVETILVKGHKTVPIDFRNLGDIISILWGHYSQKQIYMSQEYVTP